MHFRTHAKPTSLGQSGRWQSEYHDVMIDHDKTVGQLLAILDELGIAEDTIVFYSTDNGPHRDSWPDAGTTPFRSEKNTNKSPRDEFFYFSDDGDLLAMRYDNWKIINTLQTSPDRPIRSPDDIVYWRCTPRDATKGE